MKEEFYEASEYLTPREIASRIGLKTARPVNDAINRGELPAFEPAYNHRIVRSEDFRAWIDSKRVTPSVVAPISQIDTETVDLLKTLSKAAKAKSSTTMAPSDLAVGQTLHGLI